MKLPPTRLLIAGVVVVAVAALVVALAGQKQAPAEEPPDELTLPVQRVGQRRARRPRSKQAAPRSQEAAASAPSELPSTQPHADDDGTSQASEPVAQASSA